MNICNRQHKDIFNGLKDHISFFRSSFHLEIFVFHLDKKMQSIRCLNNTTSTPCIEFNTYMPCSPEEDHCVEGQGFCGINKANQTKCLCLYCFTGDHCEHEISRNLWHLGLPQNIFQYNSLLIECTIVYIYLFFLIMNGLLCLQTYLCKKIRQTNLGVYLIMISILSILFGITSLICLSIGLIINEPSESMLFIYAACIHLKHVYPSILFMFNWFTAAVAIERVLIQCSINYSLHDSRCRSIKVCLFIFIICLLSTLPDIFTVRDSLSTNYPQKRCRDFTEIGYIIHQIIRCIHYFAFYFVYIVMNVIVLVKLIRRRQRFVENESTIKQSFLILKKHKDFFIPYLVLAFGQLPDIILDFVITCSTADKLVTIYAYIIAVAAEFISFTLTFYLYVGLSPVYLTIFWDCSIIGKCLVNIKQKLQTIHRNRKYYDYLPLINRRLYSES